MTRGRKSWREYLMPHVAEAIESGRAAGLEGAKLARYAAKSYPWGTSQGYWPRKVWVSEVKRQLRLSRMKAKPGGEHLPLFDGGLDS